MRQCATVLICWLVLFCLLPDLKAEEAKKDARINIQTVTLLDRSVFPNEVQQATELEAVVPGITELAKLLEECIGMEIAGFNLYIPAEEALTSDLKVTARHATLCVLVKSNGNEILESTILEAIKYCGDNNGTEIVRDLACADDESLKVLLVHKMRMTYAFKGGLESGVVATTYHETSPGTFSIALQLPVPPVTPGNNQLGLR